MTPASENRNGRTARSAAGGRRFSGGRFRKPRSRRSGFSLIELLVALAVFASMAALAYGGLDSVVRTRAELVQRQTAFQELMRSVTLLERDLRQASARPVRGNFGEPLAALLGGGDHIEFTRSGFANPQAEARSNLERVSYLLDGDALERGVFPVLDRAPGTSAQIAHLRSAVQTFQLRYLDGSNRWSDIWPPLPAASATTPVPPTQLPRAVEFRIGTRDYGEIVRIVELVSTFPASAGP